jgi:hypothetical protein
MFPAAPYQYHESYLKHNHPDVDWTEQLREETPASKVLLLTQPNRMQLKHRGTRTQMRRSLEILRVRPRVS